MEAFEAFYAEDVAMQENTEHPIVGKAANREREQKFFEQVEAWHGATVLATGAGPDTTFSVWEMDLTLKGMPRMTMAQVAVRTWRNGQIVRERFFHK
jgi:ketosteroid isomerase-like protein